MYPAGRADLRGDVLFSWPPPRPGRAEAGSASFSSPMIAQSPRHGINCGGPIPVGRSQKEDSRRGVPPKGHCKQAGIAQSASLGGARELKTPLRVPGLGPRQCNLWPNGSLRHSRATGSSKEQLGKDDVSAGFANALALQRAEAARSSSSIIVAALYPQQHRSCWYSGWRRAIGTVPRSQTPSSPPRC